MDQALEVFVAVVDKGNFTRAAEELLMTQPAVSQYIQALERSVGTKLLERTNKYVRLTKAGEIVYHHAKDILGLYTRMNALVDDLMHRASGHLSIGSSYTFGEYMLPHLIAYMRERYPLIRPSITIGNTKEVAEMILRHEADIGIVEGDYQDEKLLIEAFAEDEMVVMVPVTGGTTICRRYRCPSWRMRPGLSGKPVRAPARQRSGCSPGIMFILSISWSSEAPS